MDRIAKLVKIVIGLYDGGSYGTPEAPIRSSSVKAAFWKGYHNIKPAPKKDTVNYPAYIAGQTVRREGI